MQADFVIDTFRGIIAFLEPDRFAGSIPLITPCELTHKPVTLSKAK